MLCLKIIIYLIYYELVLLFNFFSFYIYTDIYIIIK